MLGFVGAGIASLSTPHKVWLGNPMVPPPSETAMPSLLATTSRLLRVLRQHNDEDPPVSSIIDDDDAMMIVEDFFYERLERAENVSQCILAALDDIRKWQDHDDNNKELSFQRHAILERQRDLLLLQQKEEEQQVSKNEEDDEELDDEELSDLEEQQQASDDNEEEDKRQTTDEDDSAPAGDPWQRALRTFHSLQILTPILIKLLRHPRRNDATIAIGKTNILKDGGGGGKKRKPRAVVWLWGERVYDVCQKETAERLLSRLADLYMFLGLNKTTFGETSNEELIQMCNEIMEKTIAQAHELNNEGNDLTMTMNSCPLPFDGLEQADLMYKRSHELDEKYGLTKPLTDAEQYKLYQASTQNLHSCIEGLLKKRFPKCRLSIYGSCLSDLSLGKAADVDLSLCIPEMAIAKQKFESGAMSAKEYQNSVKKKVFLVCNLLERRSDFINMQPVHRARVPVIKGTYTSAENPFSLGGDLDFDICFLNDIAVANSGLLREYSLVDPRIKQLMIAVKRWAKANGLSSAQDNFLSSYAWMNLVVYYILRLGMAPNLQSEELAGLVGVHKDKKNDWHCVNNLDTFFLKWDEVSSFWNTPSCLENLSVSALLYGFFRFYSEDFPVSLSTVSIKRAGESFAKWKGFHRLSMFLAIEDPFETHDSHMPHDLGCHAGESGSAIIIDRFHSARDHLRRMLFTEQSDEKFLWPVVQVPTETSSKGNDPPKKKGKRNRKKKKQQNEETDKEQKGQSVSDSKKASKGDAKVETKNKKKQRQRPQSNGGAYSNEETTRTANKPNPGTENMTNGERTRSGNQQKQGAAASTNRNIQTTQPVALPSDSEGKIIPEKPQREQSKNILRKTQQPNNSSIGQQGKTSKEGREKAKGPSQQQKYSTTADIQGNGIDPDRTPNASSKEQTEPKNTTRDRRQPANRSRHGGNPKNPTSTTSQDDRSSLTNNAMKNGNGKNRRRNPRNGNTKKPPKNPSDQAKTSENPSVKA